MQAIIFGAVPPVCKRETNGARRDYSECFISFTRTCPCHIPYLTFPGKDRSRKGLILPEYLPLDNKGCKRLESEGFDS